MTPPPVLEMRGIVKRCSIAAGPCIPTTVIATSTSASYRDPTPGGSYFYAVEGATNCGTAR